MKPGRCLGKTPARRSVAEVRRVGTAENTSLGYATGMTSLWGSDVTGRWKAGAHSPLARDAAVCTKSANTA